VVSQSAHLPGVDVLRALACLWVVLFHVGLWWQGAYWKGFAAIHREATSLPGWLAMWLSRLGFHGVGMFLALSGFCLYYPLALRHGVRGASLDAGAYVRRRAGRILPAYYASIAVLVALASRPATAMVVMTPITPLDIGMHLGLVHNLYPATLWTMNGAYWSLGLEAQLYVVFPLLVLLGRRRGIGAVAALGLGASLLWFLVLRWAKQRGFPGETYGVLFESVPARLVEFSAGMVAAAFLAEDRPAPRWLLVLLSLLWIPASHLVQLTSWFNYPFDRPVNAISWGALLILVGRLPARTWAPAPARLLAWIGGISYSLYLVHQPLLLVLREHAWKLRLERWQLFLLGLLVSVGVGWVFFELFEGPAQRWLAGRKKSLRGGSGSSRLRASLARERLGA
jgi:peptidoglycan/LPS O-acetylase OafA/YrhL